MPKASSPALRLGARARHVVEHPLQLRAGEIGVDDEAGLAADQRRQPARLAAGRTARPCAGPARRWRCRSARPVSRSQTTRRLALIGDADRGDVGRREAAPCERLRRDARPASPRSRCGVVLDPAGLREDLPELLLRDRDDRAARDRRGSRASWWCPGRGRGCTSWLAMVQQQRCRASAPSDAADDRADDGHPRVAPVRAALAGDRQHAVRDARAEVARGIDGVAGRSAQRQADGPDDARRPAAGAKPLSKPELGTRFAGVRIASSPSTSTAVPMTSVIRFASGFAHGRRRCRTRRASRPCRRSSAQCGRYASHTSTAPMNAPIICATM